jgi:putative hydrolase of the HAD superfamily
VLHAIRESNYGDGALDAQTLDAALTACWRTSLDEVAETYSLPAHVTKAAAEAFATVQVEQSLSPYPDLHAIKELPGLRFLVTTGYRSFQESKIAALGLGDLFDAIFIDALDDPERKGKQYIFEHILTSYELLSAEVMVVGDNAASEIAAGNALGMATVQILRPGVPHGDNASFYIENLHQLSAIIHQLEDA